MDETTPAGDAAPLDPATSDPREVMRVLLPAARREYIKAWELLADPTTPLARRRAARERAARIADDHSVVASALRAREGSLRGDDLQNARHLASELERHVEALGRIVEVSPVGLHTAATLRPEALGCGRRYRDPSKELEATGPATRGTSSSPRSGGRPRDGKGQDARRSSRPFEDRGPKPPKDMLGSSKHDSSVADDLDEATRAKLEELRRSLEG